MEWNELIEVKYWREFGQQSIADSLALHSDPECDKFANLLLNNRLFVKAARRKNQNNDKFVLEVLEKWYSTVCGPAVPCTWKDLIDCMKRAGLDAEMIETIENNVDCS